MYDETLLLLKPPAFENGVNPLLPSGNYLVAFTRSCAESAELICGTTTP